MRSVVIPAKAGNYFKIPVILNEVKNPINKPTIRFFATAQNDMNKAFFRSF